MEKINGILHVINVNRVDFSWKNKLKKSNKQKENDKK